MITPPTVPGPSYPEIAALFDHVASLKRLRRQGWLNHAVPDPESVADHSYGVALLALVYAERLGLDRGKAASIALLHDLAESVIGDITPADGVSARDKSEAEQHAMEEILADVDPGGGLLDLWRDFTGGRTPEAVLVKDLDRLDLAFQARWYERETGQRLDEFFSYVERCLQVRQVIEVFAALCEDRRGADSVPTRSAE
jgi:putative hydrolase of HD superfamily